MTNSPYLDRPMLSQDARKDAIARRYADMITRFENAGKKDEAESLLRELNHILKN